VRFVLTFGTPYCIIK